MKKKTEPHDPLVLVWQRFMVSDSLFDSAISDERRGGSRLCRRGGSALAASGSTSACPLCNPSSPCAGRLF